MHIALDSNVFVSALSGREAHSPQAQSILRAIHNGVHTACTSVLAFSEVIGIGNDSQKLDVPTFLTLIDHLSLIEVSDAISVRAALLKRETDSALTLVDALYIATAIEQQAELFVTNDYRLARLSTRFVKTELLADWQ